MLLQLLAEVQLQEETINKSNTIVQTLLREHLDLNIQLAELLLLYQFSLLQELVILLVSQGFEESR